MTENQSLWGKVVFLARFSESTNTTDERKDGEEALVDSENTTDEQKRIERIIDRAGNKFSAEPFDRRLATNEEAVREAIRDAEKGQNAIVHFSGHGNEVIMHDGKAMPEYHLIEGFLTPRELSPFFKDAKNIKCVVFNFCYSSRFAELASEYVECAIGIDGEIGSKAAIGFAEGFYEYLRHTEPTQPDVLYKAFRRGKSASVGDDREQFKVFFSKSASELDVEIEKPEEGSSIPYQCQFSGTFRNLPRKSTMWLYVQGVLEGRFYLIEIGYFSTDNGTWEISVPVGDENGGDFRIGVIVVDDKVTKQLRTIPSNQGQPDLPAFVGKFGERSVRRQQSTQSDTGIE